MGMRVKNVNEGIIEELKKFLRDELNIKVTMLESSNGIVKSHLVSNLKFTKNNLGMFFVVSVEEEAVIISFENIKNTSKNFNITKENYSEFLDKISKVNNGLKFGKFLLGNKEEDYVLSFRLSIMYENSLPIERFKKAVYTSLKTVSDHSFKILG